MTSTLVYDHNFAEVVSAEENTVQLNFDLDRQRWPWLALPPQHPVLVEKYQYFSSVTAGEITGMIQPNKFTALTHAQWECPLDAEIGYATQGTCTNTGNGFDLRIVDDAGRQVGSFKGQGAIVPAKDIRVWRTHSRKEALAAESSKLIQTAAPEAVGLTDQGISFISELNHTGEQPQVDALVGTDNGFYPGHPFHTGSGDHVNAAHLIDCALQMAHLVLAADSPLACSGGAAQFRRFIELDAAFTITLVSQSRTERSENELVFAFSQLGRDNTQITLRLQD